MLSEIWHAVGGASTLLKSVRLPSTGALPSVYAVTELAQASIAAAGLAVAELASVKASSAAVPAVECDGRLASWWFAHSLRPDGWEPPSLWDDIAGDYATSDGRWVRLHTNAPHHRAAALLVLGVDATACSRAAVAATVASWKAGELEAAVVAAGGCAAEMRTAEQWAAHPQGQAVAAEPLVWHTPHPTTPTGSTSATPAPASPLSASAAAAGGAATGAASDAAAAVGGLPARPLAGVRVLDLTRVLAGPTATRFLAGYGASVLRIDPKEWVEPGVIPETTLGKRCAHLDLKGNPAHIERLRTLLSEADVFVHGYRLQALERLGLGADVRRALNPRLVDVCLDAYGWTGPWAGRRGFDSLVQMSSGIADTGMRAYGKPKPTPLPVQALDHATGYIMAAAAVRGLTTRHLTGAGGEYRLSLARTAHLLSAHSGTPPTSAAAAAAADASRAFAPETAADVDATVEHAAWGPARRLRAPVTIEGMPMAWALPAGFLGSSPAEWPA